MLFSAPVLRNLPINVLGLLVIFESLLIKNAYSQQARDAIEINRKKFFDNAEVFVGPSLNIPNASAWTNFYNSNNDGSIYSISNKLGYSGGFSLTHSFNSKIELLTGFIFERKGFIEKYYFQLGQGDIKETMYNQKDDCLSISLLPSFFIDNKKSLNIFSGLSYSYLLRSRSLYEESLNGTLISSGEIKLEDRKTYGAFINLGLTYMNQSIQKVRIFIRIQGNLGLGQIIKENKYEVKMNTVALSFGLRMKDNKFLQ